MRPECASVEQEYKPSLCSENPHAMDYLMGLRHLAHQISLVATMGLG